MASGDPEKWHVEMPILIIAIIIEENNYNKNK